MLALPAPPSSFLPPPSSLLPAPFSLLLLPAKPYARPYARCKFDGSGLCWRSRPLPPPSSVFPSATQNKPPVRAPMRALCAPPMRGTHSSIDLDRAPCFETSPPTRKLCASPYARDTIFYGFRSCTLPRNHYKKRDPMRKPLCAGYDCQWI